MPFYNILASKSEQAFIAIITAASVGTGNIKPGQSDDDRVFPQISVYADPGKEQSPETGLYNVTVEIRVRSSAERDKADDPDPQIAHDLLVSKIFDACLADNIVSALTEAVDDFTAVDLLEPMTGHGLDGRAFEDSLTLRLVAAPNDL